MLTKMLKNCVQQLIFNFDIKGTIKNFQNSIEIYVCQFGKDFRRIIHAFYYSNLDRHKIALYKNNACPSMFIT